LELKSPVVWERVVRAGPGPNLHVEELSQDPSMLCVLWFAVQFLFCASSPMRVCFASDAASMQYMVVLVCPIDVIEPCHRPGL
jgi:hypothetical protein